MLQLQKAVEVRRIGSMKSRAESVKSWAESVKSRTESVRSRAESVKSGADSTRGRAESVRSRKVIGVTTRRDTARTALAVASELLKTDDLLRIVREMNPELEARKQVALQVSKLGCF